MKAYGWLIWLLGTAAIVWIVGPVLLPVAMGTVLAIVAFPLQEQLPIRSAGLRALVSTVATGLLVVVPVSFFSALGVRALLDQFKENRGWESWLTISTLERNPIVLRAIRFLARLFHTDSQALLESIRDWVQSLAIKAAGILGLWVGQVPKVLFAFGLMGLSLFFLLKDGPAALRWIQKRSPFSAKDTAELFRAVSRLCRAIVLATLVTGLTQALLFSVGALIVGMPQVLLIGGLIFIASFLPVVGSLPVTLTLVASEFLSDHIWQGVVLAIFALVISLVDNLIRPWLLKEGASLHPLITLLAVFGGVQAFGFAGIFLGPLSVGLTLLMIERVELSKPA